MSKRVIKVKPRGRATWRRGVKSKYWWVEDLVDSEAKAMGTYLAELLLLTLYSSDTFESKPSGAQIMSPRELSSWLALYFAGRGAEARQAFEAGTIFVDRLFEHEDALSYDKRNQVLGEIEAEFHNKFVKAFKKHSRLDVIPEELREKVRDVLLDIRAQLYRGEVLTPLGTTDITENTLKNDIEIHQGLKGEDVNKLVSCLASSGLMLKYYYFCDYYFYEYDYYFYDTYYVFPAPCLSDEVIELLAKPEKPAEIPPIVEMRLPIPPPPKPEHFDVKPSRDVLEGIVASVFESLGFNVVTNARKEPRKGSPIEVDVWAWKRVADTRFSVYVSCKNWNKAVDRSVIDEETGRILNLRELPQLKVIIAKEATAPAKEVAEANGFVIIELRRKAEAKKAREIYELVYRALNKVFTSIASTEAGERRGKPR
jgi:hypothetical protein